MEDVSYELMLFNEKVRELCKAAGLDSTEFEIDLNDMLDPDELREMIRDLKEFASGGHSKLLSMVKKQIEKRMADNGRELIGDALMEDFFKAYELDPVSAINDFGLTPYIQDYLGAALGAGYITNPFHYNAISALIGYQNDFER
ncbi:MAG: hypothetical protein GY710_15700 [Desulfobacteraceae bacterium]|nr:hypothetical protein [Desulfobacteraceae bacterium]